MRRLRGRVLVADDEGTMLELFRETLSDGWDVRLARDGTEAADLLDRETFDVAFLDLRMPGRDGAELVRRIRQSGSDLPTVVMSAHAGQERRDEILGGGADRFLEKPFLPEAIEEAANALARRNVEPRRLIVSDPRMSAVLAVVRRVAPTRATILLQGETGTGKELLAREVHEHSGRALRPFIRINCAALTEGLLESELFGHERGSFTGAVRTTQGLFQVAHGGTLLLDEISEISVGLQAKLLRVLQEREIRRVGGSRSIVVDARIIATTNRELAREVGEGRFRADLYHRLNVVRIDVPPLRERPEDLIPLSDAILERKAEEHDLACPRLTERARAAMARYPWPGNVRELENALERALLLATERTIDVDALELTSLATSPEGISVGNTLRDAERKLVLATLKSVRGNRTRAAAILGISVRTMRNKLAEYRDAGLLPPEEKP